MSPVSMDTIKLKAADHMLVHCPQCNSAFACPSEILAYKAGWLRCEVCQHIFDGYDAIEAPLLMNALEPVSAPLNIEEEFIADKAYAECKEIIHIEKDSNSLDIDVGVAKLLQDAMNSDLQIRSSEGSEVEKDSRNIPIVFASQDLSLLHDRARRIKEGLLESIKVATSKEKTEGSAFSEMNEATSVNLTDEIGGERVQGFNDSQPEDRLIIDQELSNASIFVQHSNPVMTALSFDEKAPAQATTDGDAMGGIWHVAIPSPDSSMPLKEIKIESNVVLLEQTREAAMMPPTVSVSFMKEKKATRWTTLCLIGVLLAGLALQALYWQRSELSSWVPETRPWLENICKPLNCAVPYVKNELSIEMQSADLKENMDGGGINLHAVILNKSEQDLLAPSIQLEILDADGYVTQRTTITAEDWLGTFHLDPKQEVSLKLALAGVSEESHRYKALLIWPD